MNLFNMNNRTNTRTNTHTNSNTARSAALALTLSSALLLGACGGESSNSNSNNSNTSGNTTTNSTQNTNNNTSTDANNSGSGASSNQQQAGGLFTVRGDWALMDGEITTQIVDQLNTLVKNNPQVKTIVMVNVPGSSDDEMNLKAGLRLRQLGLNTYLPPGGEIASGGVDLFLAGKERFAAQDVLVGVHSWGADDVTDASTLGRDHADHKPYLDYYKAIGINEDFYWYTIEAATADDIHWMTAAERQQYGIVTRKPSAKELNMIANTASGEAAINSMFSQYTWVTSSNNKPIHIFAVDKVAPLQLAKARAVMQHYLTNVDGLQNKDAMSAKLSDNQASLFMFATQADSETAFEGSLGQTTLAQHGQDLYASEVFVEGTHGYLKRSTIDARDATYEEVLHLVQGHGLAPAEKTLQDRIVTIANQALADKSWNPTQQDVTEWQAESDANGYTSLNYEYLAAAVEGFYGIWGYSDRGLDGYLGTNRTIQQQKDPDGLALIEQIWPAHIATMMHVSADFAADQTFSLQYNSNLEYSSQSQYLSHVALTGNNNSHILGNAENNRLKGNQGNNRLDGAGGDKDIAIFAGLKSEYQISQQNGAWHVVDSVSGRDGHDELSNIEFIQFRDQQVNVNDL